VQVEGESSDNSLLKACCFPSWAAFSVAAWRGSVFVASVQLAPAGLPRINEIAVDSRVLLFVVAVSLASGILFGLAPAVTLARKNLVQTLKNRGVARGSARSGSQTLVVIAEISICFTLLVGGGLLVRSLIRLSHVDPGFNPSNLLAVQVALPMEGYRGPQILSLYQKIFADLESLSGVLAVTGSSYAPFQEDRACLSVYGFVLHSLSKVRYHCKHLCKFRYTHFESAEQILGCGSNRGESTTKPWANKHKVADFTPAGSFFPSDL
jgi:hypothetical protein